MNAVVENLLMTSNGQTVRAIIEQCIATRGPDTIITFEGRQIRAGDIFDDEGVIRWLVRVYQIGLFSELIRKSPQ